MLYNELRKNKLGGFRYREFAFCAHAPLDLALAEMRGEL